MDLNRLISWVSAFLLFLILEMALSQPTQIYWLILLSFAILLFSIWQLMKYKVNQQFFNFLIAPVIFLASAWIFLLFLQSGWIQQLIIIVTSVLYWLFIKVIFLYLFRRPKYQAHTLGNISSYLDLLAVFFISSGFFSLMIFLQLPSWYLDLYFFQIVIDQIWQLLFLEALVVSLLTYQLLWASQIPLVSGGPFIFVITLVTTQLFLVTSFLPTSVYVKGLIVGIVFYLLSGLSRNWLLNIREWKVVRRYLTIGLISLIIILASAKWF